MARTIRITSAAKKVLEHRRLNLFFIILIITILLGVGIFWDADSTGDAGKTCTSACKKDKKGTFDQVKCTVCKEKLEAQKIEQAKKAALAKCKKACKKPKSAACLACSPPPVVISPPVVIPQIPQESDTDSDGVLDSTDNCPYTKSSNTADTDGDGIGNACDLCPKTAVNHNTDTDKDGIGTACDNCPYRPNPDQTDSDGDGIGSVCDNCPAQVNPDQKDENCNKIGDSCEQETDPLFPANTNCFKVETTDPNNCPRLCEGMPGGCPQGYCNKPECGKTVYSGKAGTTAITCCLPCGNGIIDKFSNSGTVLAEETCDEARVNSAIFPGKVYNPGCDLISDYPDGTLSISLPALNPYPPKGEYCSRCQKCVKQFQHCTLPAEGPSGFDCSAVNTGLTGFCDKGRVCNPDGIEGSNMCCKTFYGISDELDYYNTPPCYFSATSYEDMQTCYNTYLKNGAKDYTNCYLTGIRWPFTEIMNMCDAARKGEFSNGAATADFLLNAVKNLK